MKVSTRVARRLVFPILLVSVFGGALARTRAVDCQAEYDKLKAKIDREFNKPTVSEAQCKPDPIGEFIRWMEIKAADRNKANGFAAQAQTAKVNMMGAEVTSTTEVLECSDKTPPAGNYDIPAGYKKVKTVKG